MQLTLATCKNIITACAIIGAFAIFRSANGYFEHTYFCVIEDNTVSVSIQEGDKLCFEYLASLQETIVDLDASIFRAENYVNVGTQDDRTYRRGVVADLQTKKQERISLRERLLVAIDDYERDLFLRIKGLVGFYLKPEREVLFDKVSQASALSLRLKAIGDIARYEFILEKIDGLQYRIALLDRIKFSQDFSELMPALKEYLQGPRINKEDLT